MTDYFYQLRRPRHAPGDGERRAHGGVRDTARPSGDELYPAESAAASAAEASLWYEDRTAFAAEPPAEDDAGYGEPEAPDDWPDEIGLAEDRESEDGDDAGIRPQRPRDYVPGGQAAAARAAAASGARSIRFDPTKERGPAYYDRAARHSRHVRLLKVGLPAIALVAIAGFFLFMTLGEKGDGLPALTLSGIDLDTREITMDKPHISGFDGTKRAYEVTAAKAVQALGNPKVVALETIDAKFAVSDDVRANLTARAGVYDADTQKLQLDGGIDISTDNGYTGRLEAADVDVGEGTVFSDSGVTLRGKEGQITADSIEVLDRGKHIFFRGNVKVRYAPPEESGAGSAAATAGSAPAETPAITETASDGST